jgi:hypothetical protein
MKEKKLLKEHMKRPTTRMHLRLSQAAGSGWLQVVNDILK